MTIDIWSDLACPYCYIGKRHLEAALQRFAHAPQVQINWRSFELDPEAPATAQGDLYDRLSDKYRLSRQQAQEMTHSVEAMGTAAGITFDFAQVVPVNTLLAHRLLHYAALQGRQDEAKETLFRAYFCDGEDLSRIEVLVRLAEAIGLDPQAVETMLQSRDFEADVRTDEQMAYQMGVQGVPFFVFDQKYALRGAQPVEAFVQTLEAVWEKAQASIADTGAACEVDGCD